MIINKGLL